MQELSSNGPCIVAFRKQLLSPLLLDNPLCVVVVAKAKVASDESKSSLSLSLLYVLLESAVELPLFFS